jgi:hypothetical protein
MNLKGRMTGMHWAPAASDIEIWATPAGWAESIYKAGLMIDTSDPLTFLNRVQARSFNITMSLKDSSVEIELEHAAFLGSDNSYEKIFPLKAVRDLVILAVNDAGQKAMSVVCNLHVQETSLKASIDDHVMVESIKLIGTIYYPLKEIE